MQAKTKELLYLLLWTGEMLYRPTFRNVTESFEGWAYRKGLLRQSERLERQQLLEQTVTASGDRLHRLTAMGRLQALGGRDPEACWKKRWDGRWRLVLFDVPEARSATRNRLRRYLQRRGFGYLQHSAWITPHPVDKERALLAELPAKVGSLLLLEAEPCAGESEAEIVAAAWDFGDLNRRYSTHQEILIRRPKHDIASEADARNLSRWLGQERSAWQEAVCRDPLLPEALLPEGYSGRNAWRDRQAVMVIAGEQMRNFNANW